MRTVRRLLGFVLAVGLMVSAMSVFASGGSYSYTEKPLIVTPITIRWIILVVVLLLIIHHWERLIMVFIHRARLLRGLSGSGWHLVILVHFLHLQEVSG